eukprot:9469020-Pyramimonas_sp.AAC.1
MKFSAFCWWASRSCGPSSASIARIISGTLVASSTLKPMMSSSPLKVRRYSAKQNGVGPM